MIELPPEASALLEKARRDHNPTSDDAERIRRSLHAKLGIAAALAPSMLPTQAAASAAKIVTGSAKSGALLFGLKTKVLLAVVTLSGAASVPLMMRSDVTPGGSPPPASCAPHCGDEPSAPVAHVTAEPTAQVEPAVMVEPTPSAEPLLDRKAQRRVRRHERRQRAAEAQRELRGSSSMSLVASPSRASGVEPVAQGATRMAHAALDPVAERATSLAAQALPDPVAAAGQPSVPGVAQDDTTSRDESPALPELTLIRGALTSLRDGAPQRALTLLGEHAAHYREGAFASERRGLRIVALCALGRLDEGLRERVVFLRREGSAPVAERVRHACQEAPGK